MYRIALIIAVLLAVPVQSQAQFADYQWQNQELIERGASKERYVTIARGDIAHCQNEARQNINQGNTTPDCSSLASSPNPFLFQDCNERVLTIRRNAEQNQKDIMLSCMAHRGWEWKKLK